MQRKYARVLILFFVAAIATISLSIFTAAQKSELKIVEKNQNIESLPELDTALRLQTVLRNIAEKTTPGVVSIEVEGSIPVQNPMINDPFFRFFFGDSERIQRQYNNMGSGFIITSDGYLFSNWHVVKDASLIRVLLSDGRTFDAKLIGADTELDVALLKIEGKDLPVVPIGDSDESQVGDFVVAIGNPFGLSGTFTFGTVSALGREGMFPGLQRFIQTDVAVNPGNSGGPLLNIKGQAVGINTAIRSQSGGYEGISFAIPINAARQIAEQLFRKGSIERGFLGLVPQEIDAITRKSLGLKEKEGVLISSLEINGPAEKSGLKQGDIITKADGKIISSPAELTANIAGRSPKTSVELEIVRNGERKNIIVTLGTRPSAIVRGDNHDIQKPSAAGSVEFQKVIFEAPSPQELRKNGAQEGVVVRSVDPSSKLGFILSRGDIIAAINNTPIPNLEAMKSFAQNNANTKIFAFAIYKNGFLVYRSIEF